MIDKLWIAAYTACHSKNDNAERRQRMAFFNFMLLLGIVICCSALDHRNVARRTVALIPSVSPTQPAIPLATIEAESKKHSKHVNDFYKLYGWLKPGTSVPEPELPKAIRKIQKVLKEPVTGVFSDKMTSIMNSPRCGTEQPYNETAAKAPVDLHKRYVVWGPKWTKTSLTWKFISYSSDLSAARQQSTIRSVNS